MEKPRRIQRKATKGWRLPPNTIYVGRGSKWGNPFPFDHQVYLGKAWALAAYDHWLHTSFKGATLLREHLHELEGKNLCLLVRAGRALSRRCAAGAGQQRAQSAPAHKKRRRP